MRDSEKYLNTLLEYLEEKNYSNLDLDSMLSTAARDHPEMSDFIHKLLADKDNAENWFSEIVQSIDNAKLDEHYLEAGDEVGSYKVSTLIKQGGMSQIYLADRIDGEFEQTVVIKVMDARLDSELHIDYFKQEKMILASLNHPNIGKIFDGGMLPGGQPYYVMEYVEGGPVNEFVEKKKYNQQERIQLFLTICKAVSFAHKNLIIHKDLKPQNIFVDINGHIKLLDFGVADSISRETKDMDFQTLFVTRKYASPEMLKHQPVDISSDIFQLGLVLYEMVAGILPESDFGEYISLPNQVRKDDPGLYGKYPMLKQIDNELQAILTKALAENPEERYQSVTALQDDLEDYLANRPVHIYSNSIPYLIKKFTKRNPLFSRAFLVFVFLTSALTLYHTRSLTNQRNIAEANAIKAEQAAARSEASLNYLKNLFYETDPYQSDNKHEAKFLDSVLLMAYSGLDAYNLENTTTKADILITLADVLRSRNHHQTSLQALNRARKIMTQNDDIDEVQFSRLYYNLAFTYIHEDYNIDSALFYIQKAIAIDSLNPRVENDRLTWDLDVLGRIYGTTRDFHKAAKYYSQSLERLEQKKRTPEVRKHIAVTKSMLGEVYLNLSEFKKAERLLIDALKIKEIFNSDENGYYINVLSKLAHLYDKLGEYDKVITYAKRFIRLSQKTFGEYSPKLISPNRHLSLAYSEKQNFDSAIFHGEEALNLATENYGSQHIEVAYRHNTLGVIYNNFGILDSSLVHHQKSLRIKEKKYSDAESVISVTKYNLAQNHLLTGNTSEAKNLLLEVLEFEYKTYGRKNATVAITERLLAQAYIDSGEFDAADTLLQKVGEVLQSAYDKPHKRVAEYFLTAAEMYLKDGEKKKSLKLASRAKDIYQELYDEDSWQVAFSEAFHGIIAKNLNAPTPAIKEQYLHGMTILENMQPKHQYYYEKLLYFQSHPL